MMTEGWNCELQRSFCVFIFFGVGLEVVTSETV